MSLRFWIYQINSRICHVFLHSSRKGVAEPSWSWSWSGCQPQVQDPIRRSYEKNTWGVVWEKRDHWPFQTQGVLLCCLGKKGSLTFSNTRSVVVLFGKKKWPVAVYNNLYERKNRTLHQFCLDVVFMVAPRPVSHSMSAFRRWSWLVARLWTT